jgi:hypothetical protein
MTASDSFTDISGNKWTITGSTVDGQTYQFSYTVNSSSTGTVSFTLPSGLSTSSVSRRGLIAYRPEIVSDAGDPVLNGKEIASILCCVCFDYLINAMMGVAALFTFLGAISLVALQPEFTAMFGAYAAALGLDVWVDTQIYKAVCYGTPP